MCERPVQDLYYEPVYPLLQPKCHRYRSSSNQSHTCSSLLKISGAQSGRYDSRTPIEVETDSAQEIARAALMSPLL
ncbi:hypothetical protein NPIL_384901 [Nephila pilipes]|uniref:Uncharacterized protein n=1 Tax=Nephila pilipes TaxID=299642 RepID=A0A8X6UGP6_NEPPI|nr:hypothetical protein NPIL_384901 [Nephila pilipes]